MNRQLTEAIRLLAYAVNVMLRADGAAQRVTPKITVTRRNGYTIIAFEEKPHPPTGDVPPPIDRTHLRRDPARGG